MCECVGVCKNPGKEQSVLFFAIYNIQKKSINFSGRFNTPPHSRNRAVHGDSVVVRLLPQAEWRGRSHTLPHTETTPTPSRSATSVIMATGVVVSVAERADREYVASFEVSEPLIDYWGILRITESSLGIS